MLYTCGLDSVSGRDGFELHGTHHNTPAVITAAKCDENGIFVEADIRETALFGKNLVFSRKVYTTIGSGKVEITDTIRNAGYAPEKYCVLYHVNVGYPMLDRDTRLECPAAKVTPRTDWAKQQIDAREIMTDCVPNQEEMCYFLDMEEPTVSFVNRRLGKKFTLSWSKETLPYFVEWKSMASGDYALGLEPCTTELDDRFRYQTIRENESKKFRIEMTVDSL